MNNSLRSAHIRMSTGEFFEKMGFPENTELLHIQSTHGLVQMVDIYVSHQDLPEGIPGDEIPTVTPIWEKVITIFRWGHPYGKGDDNG